MSWEDDLQVARSDPEAAARMLGHAAGFMRRGEALPAALAEHIAGAFEKASDHAAREGVTGVPLAKKLGALLNLKKAKRGRPLVAAAVDPEQFFCLLLSVTTHNALRRLNSPVGMW